MVRLFVQDAVARGQILVMDAVEVNLFGNGNRTNLGMLESGMVRENFTEVERNLSCGDLADQTEQDRRCLMSA
jgi:hypothetical protein